MSHERLIFGRVSSRNCGCTRNSSCAQHQAAQVRPALELRRAHSPTVEQGSETCPNCGDSTSDGQCPRCVNGRRRKKRRAKTAEPTAAPQPRRCECGTRLGPKNTTGRCVACYRRDYNRAYQRRYATRRNRRNGATA